MDIFRTYVGLIAFVFGVFQPLTASKLVEMNVVDKDYLMFHFKDGVVEFVDDGLGENAYHGHHAEADNSQAKYYGESLDLTNAVDVSNWVIKSTDDTNYGESGMPPLYVIEKQK